MSFMQRFQSFNKYGVESVYQIKEQKLIKQMNYIGYHKQNKVVANKTKLDISRISFGNQQSIRHLYFVLFVRLGTQCTCETLPYYSQVKQYILKMVKASFSESQTVHLSYQTLHLIENNLFQRKQIFIVLFQKNCQMLMVQKASYYENSQQFILRL
ncbi:Hypothetical_protein [Hexamita inflata]|uniref:Hypothetical_protein n=1 Tax=Hexamita inflata TaxID=28002 RepID=A0AA86P907_9EUKA|nr:Hypothetical protein HINF_LOCUS20080 [Hexamita inflata]